MASLDERRTPRQRRSRATQRAILEAAERVLIEEGARAFNTNRVAEVAGVSVGSLYQYFPNKAAILLRLHIEETADTFARVTALLEAPDGEPAEALRGAMRAFFETESVERPLREALALAEVLYRDTESFQALDGAGMQLIERFLARARPDRETDDGFEARFVYTVVTRVAESATSASLSPAELRRWADAASDMLIRHLQLADGSDGPTRAR